MTITTYLYLQALVLTVAVEVAVATALVAGMRGWRRRSAGCPRLRVRAGRLVALVVAVNLVTHPLFWHTFPLLPGAYVPRLTVAELVVTWAEGTLYAALGGARPAALAYAISAAANLASWWLGALWL